MTIALGGVKPHVVPTAQHPILVLVQAGVALLRTVEGEEGFAEVPGASMLGVSGDRYCVRIRDQVRYGHHPEQNATIVEKMATGRKSGINENQKRPEIKIQEDHRNLPL